MPAIPEARPPPWNQTSTEVTMVISKSIVIQMLMSYLNMQKRADRPVPKRKTTCRKQNGFKHLH